MSEPNRGDVATALVLIWTASAVALAAFVGRHEPRALVALLALVAASAAAAGLIGRSGEAALAGGCLATVVGLTVATWRVARSRGPASRTS